MNTKPSISIIGFGRVGKALYYSLKEKGYPVKSVFSRTKKDIPEYEGDFPEDLQSLGKLTFFTVTDAELAAIAELLALLEGDFSRHVFVHCSGTLSSSVFKKLKSQEVEVASFHPLKAVTDLTREFSGTWFDVEGSGEAVNLLAGIANEIGANTITITEEVKPLLHIAAVMASNYVVTLLKVASQIASESGLNEKEASEALLTLMQSSIKNIEAEGVDRALTGPIERADTTTIENHLNILKKNEAFLTLYKTLGIHTVQLSKSENKEALETIKRLLK